MKRNEELFVAKLFEMIDLPKRVDLKHVVMSERSVVIAKNSLVGVRVATKLASRKLNILATMSNIIWLKNTLHFSTVTKQSPRIRSSNSQQHHPQ